MTSRRAGHSEGRARRATAATRCGSRRASVRRRHERAQRAERCGCERCAAVPAPATTASAAWREAAAPRSQRAEGYLRERQRAHPQRQQERADEVAGADDPGDFARSIRRPRAASRIAASAAMPRSHGSFSPTMNARMSIQRIRNSAAPGSTSERLGGDRRAAVPAQHPAAPRRTGRRAAGRRRHSRPSASRTPAEARWSRDRRTRCADTDDRRRGRGNSARRRT